MSLTAFDYKIFVSSLIFVILLSFVGPAVGMGGSATNATDIPDFSLNTDRFDFARDLPDYPSEPSSGLLNHSSTRFDNYRGSIQTELGPAANDPGPVYIVAIDPDTVYLSNTNDNTVNDTVNFTANGQTKSLSAYGYSIDVHAVDISANAGEFEWVATRRPSDSSLPLIGGAINTADSVAAGVIWIGSTFVVISMLIVEVFLNIGGLIFDLAVFFVSLLVFIASNYSGIVSNAPSGFAAVITAIPGVVFAIQFGRVGRELMSMLPFVG